MNYTKGRDSSGEKRNTKKVEELLLRLNKNLILGKKGEKRGNRVPLIRQAGEEGSGLTGR